MSGPFLYLCLPSLSRFPFIIHHFCKVTRGARRSAVHLLNEIDFSLTQIGTIEMELASGERIEEDVYSGMMQFEGNALTAEIILTDAEDTFIGTGLLTGKVLVINFVTREVTIQDHGW